MSSHAAMSGGHAFVPTRIRHFGVDSYITLSPRDGLYAHDWAVAMENAVLGYD